MNNYDQWNGLNGDVIKDNPFVGMVKKWKEGESYAIMLPIPSNPEIQKQVIKDISNKKTFGGESCCEIEHLFYGQSATANYYKNEPCVGASKIVFISDTEKVKFAKEVVPKLEPNCFEVFREMFNFIKSKY
ncbi:MAG: hypothetical protein AB1861_28475 [Cyanobacteriota bacterium]